MTANHLARLHTLKPGTRFDTALTRRSGIVLGETHGDGIVCAMGDAKVELHRMTIVREGQRAIDAMLASVEHDCARRRRHVHERES